jgi:hypothetical protein
MKNAASPNLILPAIGVAILLVTAGCHSSGTDSDEAAARAQAPQTYEAAVAAVNNDPNMPAMVKQIKLQQLARSHNGQVEGMPQQPVAKQ